MGFYLQDDMWEGASALPRKQRDEVVGALAQLYFDGTEAPLKGAALAVFLTCQGARPYREIALRGVVAAEAANESKANQSGIKSESKRYQTRIKIEPPY